MKDADPNAVVKGHDFGWDECVACGDTTFSVRDANGQPVTRQDGTILRERITGHNNSDGTISMRHAMCGRCMRKWMETSKTKYDGHCPHMEILELRKERLKNEQRAGTN